MCSEAAKKVHRTRHRVKRYGLTVERYDEMVAAQGGNCLICEKPPRDGAQLAVDHDHTTGTVRGLLCRPCNLAIGTLRDDPDAALRASMYLLQK